MRCFRRLLNFSLLSKSCNVNFKYIFAVHSMTHQVQLSAWHRWPTEWFYPNDCNTKRPRFNSRRLTLLNDTFFDFHAGCVKSDSVVVSDYQGVAGVPYVCISVQCTHSACQKQRHTCPHSQYTMTKMPRVEAIETQRESVNLDITHICTEYRDRPRARGRKGKRERERARDS